MSLRPLAASDWITTPIRSDEQQRKISLYQRCAPSVYRQIPEAQAAASTVAKAIKKYIQLKHWPVFASDDALPALFETSLSIPEDICVLLPSADGYRLMAASVCSPSFWSLAEKIGQPLSAVHAPVKSLNEKLGERIEHFLEHLQPERFFERRNWFIHAASEGYQPASELFPDDVPAERLWIRSERQAITKIKESVVFTIAVQQISLTAMQQFPEQAALMLSALDSKDVDELTEFGPPHKLDLVKAYLIDCVADDPRPSRPDQSFSHLKI